MLEGVRWTEMTAVHLFRRRIISLEERKEKRQTDRQTGLGGCERKRRENK